MAGFIEFDCISIGKKKWILIHKLPGAIRRSVGIAQNSATTAFLGGTPDNF